MVDQNRAYLFRKRGIYYFSKRIPSDLKHLYRVERLIQSLRTKCDRKAKLQAQAMLLKLDDHWSKARLHNDILQSKSLNQNKDIKFTESVSEYLSINGANRGINFEKAVQRASRYLIESVGDKDLKRYTRANANSFRDYLIEKGLAGSSITRILTTIKAIVNFAKREHGFNINNHFVGLNYDRRKRVGGRLPIPLKNIQEIQRKCVEIDDELRWLVALVSDTGMRLAEATGLLVEDINLDVDLPFISLKSHTWRPLKTEGSRRDIPLVGQSLWSAKRIKAMAQSKFAFPRYNTASVTSTNTASATLNKWLKSKGHGLYTMHSFRHSLRDRLRNVNCPSEVVDQIGGWSNKTVGQGYGSGYSMELLASAMRRICINSISLP